LHINGKRFKLLPAKPAPAPNVSFTGNYTDNTMSGTFTITGSYGDMSGTFSLDRVKIN